jgi:hypothetical protein
MRDAAQPGAASRDLLVADIVALSGIDQAMIDRLVRAFYGRARRRPADRRDLRGSGAGLGGSLRPHGRLLVVRRADERPLSWPADGGPSAAAD